MQRFVDEDVPGAQRSAWWYGLYTAPAVLLSVFWSAVPFLPWVLPLIGAALCGLRAAYLVRLRRLSLHVCIASCIAGQAMILYGALGGWTTLDARFFDFIAAAVLGIIGAVGSAGCELAFVLLGALLFRSWRSFLNESMCKTCGYDLKGLTSANCPECGSSLWVWRTPAHREREQALSGRNGGLEREGGQE